MKGHKVVTVERQGGYAARCTCGDITFGGFATRTEARAALTHENAPDVGQDIEGEDRNPTKGTIMTIVQNHTEIHPDIQQIFNEIAECPEDHVIVLGPEDPFYKPETDTMAKPLARLGLSIEEAQEAVEKELPETFIAMYGPDGIRTYTRDHPEGWWGQLTVGVDKAHLNAVTRGRRNTVCRAEDHLIVGWGAWYPSAIETVDGEPSVVFITQEEYGSRLRAQQEAARAEVRAAHPEIEANKPAWADKVYIETWKDPDDTEVIYEGNFGHAFLSVLSVLQDGQFRPSEASSGYIPEASDLTVAQLRAIAADIVAAADALEV